MTTRIHKLNVAIAVAAATLILSATSAQAVILGPYTVDANTVNLWHFDENVSPGTRTTLTNAAGTLVMVPSNSGSPSFTDGGSSGHPAFTGFGLAGRLNRPCCGNGGPNELAWRDGSVTATELLGSTSGAFTIETLLNFNAPLGNDFTEIWRTESTSFRGRIENGNQFALTVPDFETGTTPAQTVNPGTWYHLALTYDGTNTANIYFTEMNNANTSATLVHTFNTNDEVFSITDFEIGSDSGGQINAFIDEMRISNIARAADEMMFGTAAAATPEPSTLVLALLSLVGLTLTRRRRRNRK